MAETLWLVTICGHSKHKYRQFVKVCFYKIYIVSIRTPKNPHYCPLSWFVSKILFDGLGGLISCLEPWSSRHGPSFQVVCITGMVLCLNKHWYDVKTIFSYVFTKKHSFNPSIKWHVISQNKHLWFVDNHPPTMITMHPYVTKKLCIYQFK